MHLLRGIRFNLTDARICDGGGSIINRRSGPGQIIPCAKKVFYACQMASTPKLMQPMYAMEIFCAMNQTQDILEKIRTRDVVVNGVIDMLNGSKIYGILPVLKSFGFVDFVKSNDYLGVRVNIEFSHWEIIDSDPFKQNSDAYQIMMKVRSYKGLKTDRLPVFNDYYDTV